MLVLELPRRRDRASCARVDDARLTVPRAPALIMVPTRWLRRLTDGLSPLVANDGMSARFAAERERDEVLVRRVERRRRLWHE